MAMMPQTPTDAMSTTIKAASDVVPGSFRDPKGRVYNVDGKIYRALTASGCRDWDLVVSTELPKSLEEQGKLVPWKKVDIDLPTFSNDPIVKVLEHPPIPYISYP